ncbi:Astacin [Diplonema papillatum]|nr:Astacin [Diplonema papillatum]
MLRFCALLLICSAAESRKSTREPDYVLADAVEEPKVSTRRANPLGASIERSQLWDLSGKVNYVIQTEASSPDAGSRYLPADDSRVLAGIADWEAKTCIRFTRCLIQATCPQPYMVFRGGEGCGANIGPGSGVVYITLELNNCGVAGAVHEIGHVMGLEHEHTRSDRDNYVRIDLDQFSSDMKRSMEKVPDFRNIGVYDYASIMHYFAHAWSVTGLPTIVTTEVVGEHSGGLSDGDVAAIDFMYNGCSNTYAAPRCITNATAALLIPHSKDFVVEFNADWNADSSMTISYGSTTASGAIFHTASGTNVGYSATEFITLNPSPSDAGSTFVLAATFTSTGAGAESSTCQVEVKVATGDRVCFGISADDESVCGGGGGTCTSDSGIPCLCTGKHTGKQCEEHTCKSQTGPTSPPCYEYLMHGSLTRPTPEDLIDGGLTLTVTIAGGDAWVDSEATKQAFIDGLTADASPLSSGWSELKSTMVNTGLVTISGSTLILGPLRPAAYRTTTPNVVSLALDASMVTSGTLGVGSDDLFFVIPASYFPTCPVGERLTFDSSSSPFPFSVVDTSFSVDGGGSAYFGRPEGSLSYSFFSLPTPDVYTSISYYVAIDDTASLPGIDIVRGVQSCWRMKIATTGLMFSSDTDTFVDMHMEVKRFYFVEHVIDYSTGMMTVRVDGEVKIENVASASDPNCGSEGFDAVIFLNKGWLDELHVQPACQGYELTGTLTSPVQSEFVNGGLMLTVSIKGGAAWVDTEATKQAFIDGLVADSSSTAATGWNALKSTIMDTSLVRIVGSKMTLGPLRPASSFFERSSTTVFVALKASMVDSGSLGVGSGDMYFVLSSMPTPIPTPMATPSCAVHEGATFDFGSASFPHSVVDTSFSAEGSGSAYFGGPDGAPSYSIFTSVLEKYTSVSYHIAMSDTASPPGIDILQTDHGSCWTMYLTSTGLDFLSITHVNVDMPLELNRFYFVEHLIDYSTGMMTVLVDGVVKIENFASRSASTCIRDGIKSVVFLRKGWLDELRLQRPCLQYEMTGPMASPRYSELVGGGLTLTVSIGGDLEVWADTEATKQAFIDGLVADSSSTALTGWNALKSTMMDTSLVSISGSEMTLGPLTPAASFFEETSTVVSLTLEDSMVAGGTLDALGLDLKFVIPASLVCLASERETFDEVSTAFPGSVVDTAIRAVGAGSALFNGPYSIYSAATSKQVSSISFYLARRVASSTPGFDILDENWISCWHMYVSSTEVRFTSDTTASAPLTVELEEFHFFELLFDYSSETTTVRVDGQVKFEHAAKAGSTCFSGGSRHFVFLAEGWLDEFQLQC